MHTHCVGTGHSSDPPRAHGAWLPQGEMAASVCQGVDSTRMRTRLRRKLSERRAGRRAGGGSRGRARERPPAKATFTETQKSRRAARKEGSPQV